MKIMKPLLMFCAFYIMAVKMFAQKATYDLLTYTAPSDWTEEAAENTISYLGINKKTNTWCRIWIVKSTVSKGTIEADFENEWQELIVKNYQPTDSAQSTEIKEAGQGWKIKVGDAKFIFNNSDAVVMLTTMSGYNRCASIVVTTNSEDYIKDIEAFLASVDLNKPEIVTSTIEITNNNENSIIGTWDIHASEKTGYSSNNYMISGYVNRQYTFNANGTYNFYIKTYQMFSDRMFLTKENGTYQINGNNVTINPQKSVIEAWSREGSNDVWGKKLNTQNIALEKSTYRFRKEYNSEINEWKLYLQVDNETKRDGPFNNYDRNEWIYIITSPAHPIIKLPGE